MPTNRGAFMGLMFAFAAATATAETYIIENSTIRATFDGVSGMMNVTDLRAGKTWNATRAGATAPKIRTVEREAGGAALNVSMDTPAGAARARIRLDGAEILVTLAPEGAGDYQTVVFPLPLMPPQGSELVLPVDEGALVPASGGEAPPNLIGNYGYQQGGLLMPWFGIIDGDSGLMTMAETPCDWQLEVREAADAGATARVPISKWLPSQTGLRYERRLRLCLFDKGGYVAMAKRYRRFLQETGRFRTIAEKAKEIPNVSKLVGAIDVFDHEKGDGVLDWMIRNGIRRALYYPGDASREKAKKALDAGYVVSRYDIYTDVAGPELLAKWGAPKNELDHKRIGFPYEPVITRDGKPKPGFQYPVGAKGGVDPAGAKGKRIPCYYRCSECQLPWMEKIIPKQIEETGYTARFLDVETAATLLECYSTTHPLTREQDAQARRKLFDYLRSLGQVCASEGGADWASDALHYQEGSLTLNKLGGRIAGVYVGTAPFKLPGDYVRWQFNPAIRVPLHELVHHDQQWMTWRWNHTPNRWDRRDLWDDWDLIHIINAQMPIFVINAAGLKDYGDRILQTYRNVGGVLEKVGGVEMTDHRFLTKDRIVQESRFANGWRVIVNFSATTPYAPPSSPGHAAIAAIGSKSFAMEQMGK